MFNSKAMSQFLQGAECPLVLLKALGIESTQLLTV